MKVINCFLDGGNRAAEIAPFQSCSNGDVTLQILAPDFRLTGDLGNAR